MTVEAQILSKMKRHKRGTAFVARDFMRENSYESVKKALTRLVDRGEIRRVKRGVYDIAPFSQLLQKEVVPSVEEFAKAKARSYAWVITPSEQYALNLLGLSTQVPANFVFSSTGPYRKYTLGNRTVEFRHKALRELEGMSQTSALVVSALKALGNGNVTDDHIAAVKSRLTPKAKMALLKETQNCPIWMHACIEKICGEDIHV